MYTNAWCGDREIVLAYTWDDREYHCGEEFVEKVSTMLRATRTEGSTRVGPCRFPSSIIFRTFRGESNIVMYVKDNKHPSLVEYRSRNLTVS